MKPSWQTDGMKLAQGTQKYAIWVWVKIKPPGDHKVWSLFHLPGCHFGVTLFLTNSHLNGLNLANKLCSSISPHDAIPRCRFGLLRRWPQSRAPASAGGQACHPNRSRRRRRRRRANFPKRKDSKCRSLRVGRRLFRLCYLTRPHVPSWGVSIS